MKFFYIKTFLIVFFFSSFSFANDYSNWLKKEIDLILSAYSNNNISSEQRFLIIEKTINQNFAGTGIAKFIVGNAWKMASKDTKKITLKILKDIWLST